MAISDKTRKALWARSGNRCAICRLELVEKSEAATDPLIIGEECHIVSRRENGPRGNLSHEGDYDDYNNLLLLCANDHKRIDTQIDIYTTESLHLFKAVHESWVKSTLEKDVLAFTNDKHNISSLPKIKSAKELLALVDGAHLYNFSCDDKLPSEYIIIISELFDYLKDYGDILSDMSFVEKGELHIELNAQLESLTEKGLSFFGLRRKTNLYQDGKDLGSFSNATGVVVKSDHPAILGDFLIIKLPEKMDLTF